MFFLKKLGFVGFETDIYNIFFKITLIIQNFVFPNVLNRKFSAEKPYQKLVTDITYVRTGDTFIYLSTILDLYNYEIVAWKLSERNDLELVLNTINQLENKPFTKDALIHSDQGFQYTTPVYKKQVTEKIKIQGVILGGVAVTITLVSRASFLI